MLADIPSRNRYVSDAEMLNQLPQPFTQFSKPASD